MNCDNLYLIRLQNVYTCTVIQVCDEPHPLLVKEMLDHCVKSDIDEAYKILSHLWKQGHSPDDIINIIFRVCKTHSMPEYLKLEYLKVFCAFISDAPCCYSFKLNEMMIFKLMMMVCVCMCTGSGFDSYENSRRCGFLTATLGSAC